MTLPLLPASVDVIRQPPDPLLLDAVCVCSRASCVPVATVTGPDGIDLAGVSCLPRLLAEQLARTDATDGVTVEVPCWNSVALAETLGLGARGRLRVDAWARAGFLRPVDAFRSSSSAYVNDFLATEVHHARDLLAATRVGLHLGAAHRLLTGSADDRRLVAAVVARLNRTDEARAA